MSLDKEIMDRPPKVSVCVVTYNQEKYIRQCLQSIVDQETDFDFEVIVADDCSTDRTSCIVQEFADKYPIVKVIYQENNCGAVKNYLDAHATACGEYVAHMDGDDYALPTKLQKQVDIFDKNPNVSIVVHGAKIFDEESGMFLPTVKRFYSRRVENMEFLLLNLPYFLHSSKMYKRDPQEDFSYKGKDKIDCYLHIFHASKGDIYMIPEELIVYRQGVGVGTQKRRKGAVVNTKINELLHEAIESAYLYGVSVDVIMRSHARAEFRSAMSLLRGCSYFDYQNSIERSVSYKRIGVLQYSFYIIRRLPAFSRVLWMSLRLINSKVETLRKVRKSN